MRGGEDAWYYILEILGKAGEKDCEVSGRRPTPTKGQEVPLI